ncbi:hypothetical protein BBJ28_00011087 [Nothophytophthora sp. Chile5]|nr:hypothetical protein BBJ28_00011087 [Nothophytophthora sp. Chile5]
MTKFSNVGVHGSAVVAPLSRDPTDSRGEPATKDIPAVGDDDDDEGGREDLPLLKLVCSSDRDSTIETKGAATTVPTKQKADGAAWSLKRAQGLGFIVFAALNFSIVSVCVKFASHRVSSHEMVLWRMFVWLRYKKKRLAVQQEYRSLLLFRCFVGTVGVNLQFYAMSKMVLTDAVVIIFTSPISTFFLGAVVLGETINRIELFAGLTSFVGVLFVARPDFLFATTTSVKAPPFAILCALGGSFTQAIVYVTLRKLHAVDHLVAIHYFFLFGTCMALLTIWFLNVVSSIRVCMHVPLEERFLFAIFGSGFFTFVGQIFLTMGFQREKAGIASVMRYFDVVFVMVMDILVLGEHVSPSSDEDSTASEETPVAAVLAEPNAGDGAVWSMKRAQGLGFIVFAAFNFSITSVCVKFASHRVTSHETVFWRMVVALVLNLAWTRYKKRKLVIEQKYRRLLLFRCVVGTIGVNLQFYAMSKMVLTDAVVIIFTSPIFTFFLGAVVLGETINRSDLAAGTTSFLGVLFAAFLFAIVGSGFFSFVGQIFLTMGFQREKAGIASVMRYFDVVFVVGMDVVILGEHVNLYSLLGAAIIMGGASMIVLRRAHEKK